MKLRHKLPLAFTVLALLTAVAGLFGIYSLNQSIKTYAKVIQVDYANEQTAATMLVDFKSQGQEWKDLLLRGKDPVRLEKYWSAFQVRERKVAEAADKLRNSLPEGATRALVEQFSHEHASMGERYRKGLKAFQAANFDPVAGDAEVQGIDQLPAAQLDDICKQIVAGTTASIAQASAHSKQAITISLILMLVIFGASVAGGIMVSRSITRPLSEAVNLAQAVAAGDLTGVIVVRTNDEIGQLMQTLGDMNQSLVRIVREVRGGTDAIATASREIASGNLDLSSRTEQQAAALEETASSMEEMTSTVKQNADNARQANGLAATASEVALRGGKVVSQVVETMSAINGSAGKIADITGVIDGIAFQTNILALNAAVEAARAGEQGRGFAVVASEVRNLAQRSAAAAKEIKLLINDSVDKVRSGTQLVDDAGTTMSEIVDSIKRVTDIMGEITCASQEQTTGIEQINQAVSQMDEVTQQNAALVEQAAAASSALQEQAVQLTGLVSVFKLHSGTAEPQPVTPLHIVATASPLRPQPTVTGSSTTRLAPPGKVVGQDWEEF